MHISISLSLAPSHLPHFVLFLLPHPPSNLIIFIWEYNAKKLICFAILLLVVLSSHPPLFLFPILIILHPLVVLTILNYLHCVIGYNYLCCYSRPAFMRLESATERRQVFGRNSSYGKYMYYMYLYIQETCVCVWVCVCVCVNFFF